MREATHVAQPMQLQCGSPIMQRGLGLRCMGNRR
jgi:hypothetical protein